MRYTCGLGESPMQIAGTLSGNPGRYKELLAANPHKPIVTVGGQPTFESIGVGEQLNIPIGFVGDALADAFGVGSREEAFGRLAQSFGTGDPSDAVAKLAHSFGVGDCNMNYISGWLGDSISGVNFTRIVPGRSLLAGQSVRSPNGRAQLTMQPDGNFVLYDSHGGIPLWGSLTNGKGGTRATMQTDGNLVVYNGANQPLWASGTDRHPGAYLAVQDDGNVVVYAGTSPLWASGTNGYRKNIGGHGGDVFGDISHAVNQAVAQAGNTVASAVHQVSKATGLPGDQALKLATNAANEAQKAIASGANLVAKAGGDVGKFVASRAAAIAKDPLGSAAQIATMGPLALVGNPDDILKSLGIPAPSEMLKKIGVPASLATLTDPGELVKSISSPQELLSHIPGLGEMTKFVPAMPNPQDFTNQIVQAASSGDPDKIKGAIVDVGHQVADSMLMVPGLGNALSAPLSAAISAIESGSPLRTALELLLSQAPIPGEIKDVVLRPAIHGVSDIIEKHESVSDAFIAAFKEGIMTELQKRGLPDPVRQLVGDLVNAMVQVILQHKPLDQAAVGFAKKGLDQAIDQATKKFGVPKLLPSGLPVPGIPGAETWTKIDSLKKSYDDLKGFAKSSNEIADMTKGIAKLSQMASNPAIQKQIADLKTSIAARKLNMQAHKQKLDTNLGKRPPLHLAHLTAPLIRPSLVTPPLTVPAPVAPPSAPVVAPTAAMAPAPQIPVTAAPVPAPVTSVAPPSAYDPYPKPVQ